MNGTIAFTTAEAEQASQGDKAAPKSKGDSFDGLVLNVVLDLSPSVLKYRAHLNFCDEAAVAAVLCESSAMWPEFDEVV